jgi:error-prone DNA polymerase
MGWNNPAMPWSQLEQVLSGRPGATPYVVDPLAADDSDEGSVHSRRRPPYRPPPLRPATAAVEYAELHCHSNFSFLDGVSHPEELVEEAIRLGLSALAITDHDGFYGVVRFAEAARVHGLPTMFGAELSLGLPGPQSGQPDPAGQHLLVLADGPAGYARLSRTIAEAQLRGGEKGKPDYQDLEQVAGCLRDHVVVLTGCRKGHVPAALARDGESAARAELARLMALFGADRVAVELTCWGDPLDDERNDALASLAREAGLPVVATNNVHYHHPSRQRLATALAAVRARRSLDELVGWLPAAATAHLRSGAEMAARFAAWPGAVARAAGYGRELAFDLKVVAPKLPAYPVPAGYTEMSWLRKLTLGGARTRYGGNPRALRQIEYELAMIDRLGFPGYFLVVYDIVDFCRQQGIYCQGRGSAANSAVCYALGITNVDAVGHKLLFERFLAPERDGPPDIDIDIESDRREEVIQHVYAKYGRHHTAQVANVISYRPRSAVRDIARAFGFSPGQQDAWSKQIDHWYSSPVADVAGVPEEVVRYADELQTFPRHLGIHSGGMVICDRPVIEVCPVEHARMPDRTVLQWDKDDCAAVDLVKFDLLGLGMLSALRYAFDLLASCQGTRGRRRELATIPREDPEVYEMLCRADSVGVFQVESRAQMATLPRLQPRRFYDLVVEVALIRPGPIQGGSVHPYIRRKNGLEPADIPHPRMERALRRTEGVPLFQEQLMQLAIDVAGFSPTEADQLRRAMGAKRSTEKIAQLRDRLYEGMAVHGITGALADDIYHKLAAFASYGFPESHAISFAYLVYASAWLKRYYPAAFCTALLNAQPMGFYSPQSLVDDARRHGVTVRRPDINASGARASLEPPMVGGGPRNGRGADPASWGIGGPVVRLGLATVRSLGEPAAEAIEAERERGGPYRDLPELARRLALAGTPLSTAALEALATADAFGCFGLTRRQALWVAGAAAQEGVDRLPGTVTGATAPPLPGMEHVDRHVADVWATGLSPDSHPVQFVRGELDRCGAVPIGQLRRAEPGRRVVVGGVVTHRQRPATAGGITFMNLEDETGMLNVTCSPGLWRRYRRVARTSPALLVRGILERTGSDDYQVINLRADRIDPVRLPSRTKSRDFR